MSYHKVNNVIQNHIAEATGKPLPALGSKGRHIAEGAKGESEFKEVLEKYYTPAGGYEVIQLGSEGGELSFAEIDFEIRRNGKLDIYLEFKQRFVPGTNTLESISTVKSYGGLFCPDTKIIGFDKSSAPVKIYVCQLKEGFYYARYGGGWKKYILNPIDPRTNRPSDSYDIPIWRFSKMNGKFVDTPLWNNTEAIFYSKILQNGASYKKHIAGYNWNYDDNGKPRKTNYPILFYKDGEFEPYREFVEKNEKVAGRKYYKSPDNPGGLVERYDWTESDKSNLLAILNPLKAL
jgi:hypothetical protein